MSKPNVLQSSDFCSIATWKTSILHVAIFYSPRRRGSFLRTYHLILPKFYFSPTWAFFSFHREIWKSLREHSLFLPNGGGGELRTSQKLYFLIGASIIRCTWIFSANVGIFKHSWKFSQFEDVSSIQTRSYFDLLVCSSQLRL